MGKFKFSKRAYVDKIKDQRDWEGGKEEDTWHGDLNEKRKCIRFVSLDKFQKATLAVEIKDGKCDSGYMCSANCDFK
jgi:hypothetical protein